MSTPLQRIRAGRKRKPTSYCHKCGWLIGTKDGRVPCPKHGDYWASKLAAMEAFYAESRNDYETLLDADEPTTPLEEDDRSPNRPNFPFW